MYYVYEHWRIDTNTCFYVGKGIGKRAWNMASRNKYHKAIQQKLAIMGLRVKVVVICDGMTDENAKSLEILTIKKWRDLGCSLANFTIGGDGTSGLKHSAETREKMIISALRANTEEVKKKKSTANTGKKLSDEHRRKISLLNIGNKRASGKRSKEFCEHMSKVLKGRKLTPEQVEQRRAAKFLYWKNKKMRDAASGWTSISPSPVATPGRG